MGRPAQRTSAANEAAPDSSDPPLPEGSTRPTLALIASHAGVSPATVSKVLNGRADVAQPTRERVEHLLKAYHYPRTRPRRSEFIDLLIRGLDSPWAVEILRGAESECARRGLGASVSLVRDESGEAGSPNSPAGSSTGNSTGSGDNSVGTKAGNKAGNEAAVPLTHGGEGVILVTSRVSPQQRAELERTGAPLVVVDPVDLPEPSVASVGATNWAGGLSATEHLVSLGHRRIAMIGGPEDMLCSRARVDGYRAALERAELRVDPELIRYGDFRHEGGFRQSRALLAAQPRPTAIFAGSDQQALGAYEAARQAGLSIPDDLSIVGFDDLPLCEWVSPPMTTIRQPLEEMGRVAARTLFQLLDGQALVSPRVELATELQVRLSTAAPPT